MSEKPANDREGDDPVATEDEEEPGAPEVEPGAPEAGAGAGPAEGAPDTPEGDVTEPDRDDADVPAALAELQALYDTLNDRHLRLAADFTNYRRRQETELTEAWGRAQADLVRRFLDVLDDLQRVSALELADESVTVESIVEGIDLVERKFVRALEEAGAEALEPGEGDAFDPERMEAVMRVADETGERDDQVAQLFQKGYVFRGNLVRPARVSVYKG